MFDRHDPMFPVPADVLYDDCLRFVTRFEAFRAEFLKKAIRYLANYECPRRWRWLSPKTAIPRSAADSPEAWEAHLEACICDNYFFEGYRSPGQNVSNDGLVEILEQAFSSTAVINFKNLCRIMAHIGRIELGFLDPCGTHLCYLDAKSYNWYVNARKSLL